MITILSNRLRSDNELKRQTILLVYLKAAVVQPSWLPLLVTQHTVELLLDIISSPTIEIVSVARATLVLLELIAAMPAVIHQCLNHLFATFALLCSFLNMRVYDDPNSVDLNFLHLNAIVYRLFVRLYGMFPTNLVEFLRKTYGPNARRGDRCFNTENVFQRVIEPMLGQVKFHPQLIVGNSATEGAHFRGAGFEPHQVLELVGQLSLDCDEFVSDIAAHHVIRTGDVYHNFCSPKVVQEVDEEFVEEDDSIEETDYRVVMRRRQHDRDPDVSPPPPALSFKAATGSHIVRPRAISSRDSAGEKAKARPPKTNTSPFKEGDEEDNDEEVATIYDTNLDRKAEMERTKCELREWKNKGIIFSQEFIVKVKHSLNEANKRIRYKSTCLPETERLDEIYGQTPPSSSSLIDRSIRNDDNGPRNLVRLRVASKSCPILFFESKFESARPTRQRHSSGGKEKTDGSAAGGNSTATTEQHKDRGKTTVMLRNPNVGSGQSRQALQQARFKACKSVDYSREIRHFTHSRHRRASNFDPRQAREQHQPLTELISSNMRKTPHELLTEMLELNTQIYFKPEGKTSSGGKGASSGEHKGKPSMLIEGEENFRNQLALLYSQLMYERYQCALHVLGNRRRFRQIKEAESAKEMCRTAQEQMHLQELKIEELNKQLEDKVLDFMEEDQAHRAEKNQLRAQVEQLKADLVNFQVEKDKNEALLRNEIESLNAASASMYTEITATLKAQDREGQLAKLTAENAELKEKLLLFAGAYDKLKAVYTKRNMFVSAEADIAFELDTVKQYNLSKLSPGSVVATS